MGSTDGQASTAEHARLAEATGAAEDDPFEANPWYEWGPYLSERAWGTVREDYSDSGDAWGFFPHDHARSRAYRWNEGGTAGLSDVHHDLCLGLALWNGSDPILKERMFGLTGPQGNHGEDVKDYWWYLDALPSQYFHGDNGAGLGAMHQTGWTALVADLILDPPRHSRRMIFRNGHDGSTSSGMEERHDGTA